MIERIGNLRVAELDVADAPATETRMDAPAAGKIDDPPNLFATSV